MTSLTIAHVSDLHFGRDVSLTQVEALEAQLHGLKPMTDRDARADPLSGAFDFTQEPRLDPLILEPRDCPSA